MSTWSCPACGRVVPERVPVCRCGYAHGQPEAPPVVMSQPVPLGVPQAVPNAVPHVVDARAAVAVGAAAVVGVAAVDTGPLERILCQWCQAMNETTALNCRSCAAPLDLKDLVS